MTKTIKLTDGRKSIINFGSSYLWYDLFYPYTIDETTKIHKLFPQTSLEIEGTIVKDMLPERSSNVFLDWVNEHGIGNFSIVFDDDDHNHTACIIFENANDALLFKMRWL